MTTQLAAPRFTSAYASNRRVIKSISVITTGLIGIRSDHYYNPYRATLSRFLSSKHWVSVPTNIFIIEHTEGLVLFDAGMDWRIRDDPAYYPDKSTADQMHDGYFPEHLNILGARWHRINFDSYNNRALERFSYTFDLWGDGTMILIPTPGHTTGSLSMLVRCEDSPPLLFVGGLTYELDNLERDEVPRTGNKSILRDTFSRVRALKLKLPNLIILSGHDKRAEVLLSQSNLYRPMKQIDGRDHRLYAERIGSTG